MTFSQNMNHEYSVTKGWRESTTKGKKPSLNSPNWFSHISLNDSYEILIVNQDNVWRWKLFFLSLFKVCSLTSLLIGIAMVTLEAWERTLRLKRFCEWCITSSRLTVSWKSLCFVKFTAHMVNAHSEFWGLKNNENWFFHFQQKPLQLHNCFRKVGCIWT